MALYGLFLDFFWGRLGLSSRILPQVGPGHPGPHLPVRPSATPAFDLDPAPRQRMLEIALSLGSLSSLVIKMWNNLWRRP